jgi:hypothetical protein
MVAAPGYGGLKDPLLLRSLFADHPDCVLVTADYNMPLNHPLIVDEVGATIATVEPWERRKRIPLVLPEGISADEAWKREVVHRWAHSAGDQRGRNRSAGTPKQQMAFGNRESEPGSNGSSNNRGYPRCVTSPVRGRRGSRSTTKAGDGDRTRTKSLEGALPRSRVVPDGP